MPDLLLVARQERPAPGLVSSDFDQRRRWLIVTVVGLFGLSVLMLGLHLVDSGRVEAARPDAAVVVAPSVASEAVPPAAPAPKVKPAPGPQRAAPRVGGSSVSNPVAARPPVRRDGAWPMVQLHPADAGVGSALILPS